MGEREGENLVSIYTCGNKQDATIKKELLESEGSPAFSRLQPTIKQQTHGECPWAWSILCIRISSW